ncbi:MAG TPA: lysophospholipid acyltransferase family protein [Candidatus Omnitrophota bacterium]|nr:lysophospholipid acyltransferase family protein [Candidatus Omnitrophota bacterium]
MNKKEFFRAFSYSFGRVIIGACDIGAKIVPLSFLYAFANLLGFIGYKLALRHKKIAIDSLTLAFGKEKSAKEIEQICRECFNTMAGAAVEFFMFMRYPERMRKYVEIEGKEHLDKALAKGKGVVAVSAHFGSFPLLLSRLSLEGYKVNSVLRRMRDAGLDELFKKKRDKMKVGSVYTQPRKECVNDSLRVLRNNEVLFVQLDQNFGSGGIFVNFFGQKAATATGPIIFSMRTGAAIVPLFIYRLKDMRHKIVIEPEIPWEEKATKDESIENMVQKLTDLIEVYIRKYPHEWGWIHKRWKARPKNEAVSS